MTWARGNWYETVAEAQTTTTTPEDIWTLDMSTFFGGPTTLFVEAWVVACETAGPGANDRYAMYRTMRRFLRNSTPAYSQGTEDTAEQNEGGNFASGACTLELNSSTVRIRITGLSATIDWVAYIRYLYV